MQMFRQKRKGNVAENVEIIQPIWRRFQALHSIGEEQFVAYLRLWTYLSLDYSIFLNEVPIYDEYIPPLSLY